MRNVHDILVASGDLLLQNGDWVMGESTRQHQDHLLLAQKGELREFPTAGVGVHDWLLDETRNDLAREIKRQFEADGMDVLEIKIKRSLSAINVSTEAVYN